MKCDLDSSLRGDALSPDGIHGDGAVLGTGGGAPFDANPPSVILRVPCLRQVHNRRCLRCTQKTHWTLLANTLQHVRFYLAFCQPIL